MRQTLSRLRWGQDLADGKGQVVEGEVDGPPQRTNHGALLLSGLPGQLVGLGGVAEAILRSALAPLADGLGADIKRLASTPLRSPERAISARAAGVVRALGWI